MTDESTEQPIPETETPAPKKPRGRKPKPPPWWDGLSPETAQQLERMGYRCKADAMMFVRERARFVNRSRKSLYDPMHMNRPWMREGMPFRVSRELYDEVRGWLGAEPLR